MNGRGDRVGVGEMCVCVCMCVYVCVFVCVSVLVYVCVVCLETASIYCA